MNDYEFIVLLDGAYPQVPYAGDRKSNFIDLPTDNYVDVIGQRTMEDQLETAELAERLGYDGVMISEQHNGPIGVFGNALLAGAWLAARTSRMRLVINGPLMNSYRTPLRLAEEIANVDIMSKGRLSFGLPMGHGMQHHSTGVMNPAEARERFREAHDLLFKAMTTDGPFEWRGKYFHIPYVNLWPRPLQKPYPDVWIPGGGSLETLELIAKHGYTYQGVLSSPEVMLKNVARIKALGEEHGREVKPNQIAVVVGVHVAETDEQARLESEAHDMWEYQNFYKSPMHDNFPPGYVSSKSLQGILSGGYRSKPMDQLTLDELAKNRWTIAGSPATVAEKLAETAELFGAGRIVLAMNRGTKHRWLTEKSMWLFAEEVLPMLRPGGVARTFGRPQAGYQTASEFGAKRSQFDAPKPLANMIGEDRLIDVTTAHVESMRETVDTWPRSS